MPARDETSSTSHIADLHAILLQALMESENLIVFCTDKMGKMHLWNRAAEIATHRQ